MSDSFQLTDPSEDDNWNAWQAYKQRQASFTQQTQDTNVAQATAALTAYYPKLQPGVAVALARGGVTPGSPVAEQANSATSQVLKQQAPKKSWFHDLFNSTVRGAMTLASYPSQEIAGVTREWEKAFKERGFIGGLQAPFDPTSGVSMSNVQAQTDLGQEIAQATPGGGAIQQFGVAGALDPTNAVKQFQNADINTGSGFFPQGDINARQAQAARDAWQVDGHAATLGRVVAGVVSEPDTKAYNLLSGSLDLATALGADPTNVYGGELTKLRNAKRLFQPEDAGVLPDIKLSPTIGGKQLTAGGIVDQAQLGRKLYDYASLQPGETIDKAGRIVNAQGHDIGAAKLVNIDDPSVTGMIDADYKSVIPVIANQWLESRPGRAVTEHLASLDSPTDVRNAMKKKIDIETATAIADTKTSAGVQDIIRSAATDGRLRDKPYTNGFTSWKPAQQLGYQVNRKIESVRLFQSMPGEHFQLSNPTQAHEQLDRTLKNAAFDPKDSRQYTDKLARATTNEERRTVIFNALSAVSDKIAGTPSTKVKVGDAVRHIDNEEYGTVTSINKATNAYDVKYADDSQATVPVESAIAHHDELAGLAAKDMVRLYKNITKESSSYNIDDAAKEVGVEGLTIDKKTGIAIPQPLLFSQLQNEVLPGLSRKQILDIRRNTAVLAPMLTTHKYETIAAGAKKIQSVWRNMALLRGAYTLRVVGEEQLRMAANNLDSILSLHPVSALAWVVGDHNPKWANWIPKVGGKEIPIEDWLSNRAATRGARGGSDVWGKSWNDAAADEGMSSEFLGAHMQMHGDKRWAMNTKYNGWIPVSKGHEQYAAGWSRELGQVHADPLAKRLAGGWKQDDNMRLTGNDVTDAKEWWWNGQGSKYRIEMSKRGGNWSKLAEDRELNDRYVEAIDSMVQHKTANDPELRALVARGTVSKGSDITPATKDSVTKLLQRKSSQGLGPQVVRSHTKDVEPQRAESAVNHMFDLLISKPSNYLSRSPAFRQYYWKRIGELMPLLDKDGQAAAMTAARTANLGDRWMQGLVQGAQRGVGDKPLEAIDELAKSHALDATKGLLYDLGERSQFFDQLKIVFPFGEAWKEALQTYGKAFSKSPHQMYRLGQTVDGAEGSGFFYTDENGQVVFNYPLSAQVSQFVTGTYAPLKGNVSGLNLAGSGLPGVGPAIQMTLGKLVNDKPNVPDWMTQWILPTGDPDYSGGFLEAWFPGWAKRAYTAATADPSNRQFGNTIGQIARYKMQSGHYDISTEAGMQKLEQDSSRSARLMYALRGAAQFVAPTAPSPEWVAKDQDGHVTTAAKLMQDYRDMQQKDGYESADAEFLQKYGDNALLYMQPLSKGGFSPTTELHQWVQQHPDIAQRYENVYGYFAGQGGQYSNNEFERQLAMGERKQLSSKDVLELANNRVARLQYQQVKQLVGPTPNTAGKQFLKSIQSQLVDRYPGYQPDGYGSTSSADKINEIERALQNEPELQSSDVGKSAMKYLQLRAAVTKSIPSFQQTKAGAAARAGLRQYGTALVAANPEFENMWDLFDGEMKDDSTDESVQ